MMPFGETLKIPGAATATEDAKDGHQQQQPLGVTHPHGADASPAVPAGNAIRSGLAEGWAKGREQYRRNLHQHGSTSRLVPKFQSALGGSQPRMPMNSLCSPSKSRRSSRSSAPKISGRSRSSRMSCSARGRPWRGLGNAMIKRLLH